MADNLKLPVTALALEASTPLLYWLGWEFSLGGFGLLLMFISFFMPFVGLALGIAGLTSKGKSKLSIALSILAILIPIAAVAVIIILFSTRVLIISLM